MRILAAILCVLCSGACVDTAWANEVIKQFDLPAQDAAKGVAAFARQADVQLLISEEDARNRRTNEIRGTYPIPEALARLLEGTGLVAEVTGPQTYTVVPLPGRTAAGAQTRLAQLQVPHAEPSEGAREEKGDKSGRFENLDPVELQTITVSAPATLISIGKTPQSIREMPQSVSVLTLERMQMQNLTTLDDALLQAPGLSWAKQQSGTTGFSSRGYWINSYQFDGVPVISDGYSTNTGNMALYERVEVLRGADGLYVGAGDPSGSINMVRKRALNEARTQWGAQLGSNELARIDVDATGPLTSNERLRGRFVVAYEDTGYHYNRATTKELAIYGTATMEVGPKTSVTLGVDRREVEDRDMFFSGFPRYSDGRVLDLPRSTNPAPPWNREDRSIDSAFLELQQDLGQRWSLRTTLSWLDSRVTGKRGWLFGAVDPATDLVPLFIAPLEDDHTTEQLGFDGILSGPVSLFGRTHELQFGINGQSQDGASTLYNLTPLVVTGIDLSDWDPLTVPEPGRAENQPLYHGATEVRQHGAFAKARISASDRLSIILGGRLSWYDFELLGSSAKVEDSNVLTPYAGVIYDLNDQWSAYASYTDIFKSQASLRTFSGEPLDPSVGANYEVGLKGELRDGDLVATFAVFRIEESDRAQSDPMRPPSGGLAYYVNAGEVRSEGFEAELNGRVSRSWSASASYAYNESKYVRDEARQGLDFSTNTPKHMVKIWASYAPGWMDGRWRAGAGVNWNSSRYFIDDFTGLPIEQDGYALASAMVGLRLNDNWNAQLNIENLLDQDYDLLTGSTWFGNWYGEPRSFVLSLRARF